jgi:FAD/FMN-containing dehydrogenase
MVDGLQRRQRMKNPTAPRSAPSRRDHHGNDDGVLVNDVHSKLNETSVRRVERPSSVENLRAIIRNAAREEGHLSVSGGRHAMGGQQFGSGTVLLDMRKMNRVLSFKPDGGFVEVEAGIQWPALIDFLVGAQGSETRAWGIAQKQTGADRFSIGGALAANIHGRGLTMRPFIQDIASFVLIDGDGNSHPCSPTENADLFALAVGGYGLFGVVASVTLRLTRREKLRRHVEIERIDGVMANFDAKIADGFTYGDFQFSTDETSEGYLREGVMSCYRPVDPDTPVPEGQKRLSLEDWARLMTLAHTDRRKAFELYSAFYLGTSGQVYWSDTHQLSEYIDDYHVDLDRLLGAAVPGSEMITEVYVPREHLASFMERVRQDFLDHRIAFIYGTVRLIEKDDRSFMPWAKQAFACVIFNLHVDHSAEGLSKAAEDFRRLIDRAIEWNGSYFPTYHRWARRDQVLHCYPELPEFLRRKRLYDPEERFQSDWYRHYRDMFSETA